jgi:hypothetical protein
MAVAGSGSNHAGRYSHTRHDMGEKEEEEETCHIVA